MGVPRFYLWLTKKYNNQELIIKKNKLLTKFDILLIDANSLFHPVCMKVVSKHYKINDIDKLEDIMLKDIKEYLILLIDLVEPNISTYIAVDGVAPLAKIKQQRSRRFKSIHDKHFWDNIKKKHNVPLDPYWNNSAITPGTLFMKKLHNYILEWIKNTKYKIIYSSCLTPSEGEHKLLQFMKNHPNYKYVIYGLDADLIFLALSCNINNIFLLRETQQFDDKIAEDDILENNYNFVDIDKLSHLIILTINSYINKNSDLIIINNLNKINLIKDFIFMCYFLGNDFLPHIYAVDIYHNGIEHLIINYSITLNNILLSTNNLHYLIDNNNNINKLVLIEFIKNLALSEEETIKNNYIINKKNNIYGTPYQKEVMKIENLLFTIYDPIKLGSDSHNEWRKRYYKYYWNVNDNEIEVFSKKLVKHYLIGLKWVTYYYFDKCNSWNWYYPYDYPPFLSDIYNYIKNIDLDNITFNIGKPLKPFIQLLSVLPPQSHNLLPDILKNNINIDSDIIYLYPTDFQIDFINKKKYWMGIPYLPQLDIDAIKVFYNKYKKLLTKDEKSINKLQDIYYN
jgi:5'-3' exoribonuclease 1